MHIEGNGISIDVIVRTIEGPPGEKETDLEIRGVPELTEIHLGPSSGLVPVIEGIKLAISEAKPKRDKGKQIPLFCKARESYKIEPRRYDPSEISF